MYVTAANPFNPYLAQRRGAGGGDILSDTWGYLEKGAKVGGKIGLTFAGFLLLVVGALGKTLAPNGTAWDIGSMFAMIGGAIMSLLGFFQFWKTDKKITPDDLPDSHHKVDSKLEKKLRTCIQNISNTDPYFAEQDFIKSRIFRSSGNSTLRSQAIELLGHRANQQFKNTLGSYRGGADLVVDNANGPDKPLTVNEIKDSNAALVAYIISSSPGGTLPTDDFANRLNSTLLNESSAANMFSLLPDEFNLVYTVAKYWKEKNIDPAPADKNVDKVIALPVSGGTDNLKSKLKSNVSGERETAKTKLSDFEREYNYAKTLEQAIAYVLKIDGQDPASVDAKSLRNAAVLRYALIAGLNINAADLKSVYKRLREALGDENNALRAEVKKLNDYNGQIQQSIVNDLNLEINCDPLELRFKDIGSGLIRFKEVVRQSV